MQRAAADDSGEPAGQPWFIPECGIGPEDLDPDNDPEARPLAKFLGVPEVEPIGEMIRKAGRP